MRRPAFCDNEAVNLDPDSFLRGVEKLAQQALHNIDEVLPEVQTMVGALDYEVARAAALFEPVDPETFRVAGGFLQGTRTNVVWHHQSSFAARPDSEAFSVAIALLAIADEGVLRLVDAIPVFAKWRDGLYLRRAAS